MEQSLSWPFHRLQQLPSPLEYLLALPQKVIQASSRVLVFLVHLEARTMATEESWTHTNLTRLTTNISLSIITHNIHSLGT